MFFEGELPGRPELERLPEQGGDRWEEGQEEALQEDFIGQAGVLQA